MSHGSVGKALHGGHDGGRFAAATQARNSRRPFWAKNPKSPMPSSELGVWSFFLGGPSSQLGARSYFLGGPSSELGVWRNFLGSPSSELDA